MMNPAAAAIRYRTVTLVLTALLVFGGLEAYRKLGRLEDPEFTIKTAKVITRYPGASALEVAEEVTDRLETAVQQLGQIKQVKSLSTPGLSIVTVDIKDQYDKHSLPQVWDELRRKVGDAQTSLPPGTSTSIVNDDFGDVYGVFFAIYGDGYSYADLLEYAKLLRRELLLVQDVGKVALFADQAEVIYAEIARDRLSALGISPDLIYQSLQRQNLVAPGGQIEVDSQYVRIEPSGKFASIADIGNLLILQDDRTATKLYLKDVATLRRGYREPPQTILRYNGHRAIGLGVSTVAGGNVVDMGNALAARLRALKSETPIGIEFGRISIQSEAVTTAISGFVISLVEAIVIVVAVLVFAMGFRSGLIMGFILLLTVLATFILMKMKGVMLERISLGALIIALGMLVDNAIVIVEGILIKTQQKVEKVKAASEIVAQTMWPLFGATVVAVLAFAAIGASQDSTGEYCRSLFLVILYSLMLSWVLALTVTPLCGVMFLRADTGDAAADPYGGRLYRGYRQFLEFCIRRRWLTVVVLVLALVAAVFGFGFVKQSFFPPSTRPQFMVHYWLPQGTDIRRTESDLEQVETYLLEQDEITGVSTFIGGGALRFLLTYTPEEPNSAYGMLLVDVDDYRAIDGLMTRIGDHLASAFPDAQTFCRKFVLGPSEPNKIQVRLRGEDPDELRVLGREIMDVMHAEPTATDIQTDWRQRTPLIYPVVAEIQARNNGITRSEIAAALQGATEGRQIGVYREGDNLLPIILRPPAAERDNVADLNFVSIWSPVARKSIPLNQVVLGFETRSENSIIRRYNRLPTLTVKCDPRAGEAMPVFQRLRGPIEQRFDDLVQERNLSGYSLEWGGEYESSSDAQAALRGKMPIIALLMMLTVITLFNSVKKPLIIFLTVPLALIGVTAGLLIMNEPFGFMALLGFLSLTGMLIKNAIVLIDEINLQTAAGKAPYDAIITAGVSRMRPVSMAALTTVLGMIPLLTDAFFIAMAVTIMFGLSFATVLTLVVVPVLYAIFFRVPSPTGVVDDHAVSQG